MAGRPSRNVLVTIGRWSAVIAIAAAAGWLGGANGGSDPTGGEGASADVEEIVVTAPVETKALKVELLGRGTVESLSSSVAAAPLPAEGVTGIVVTRVPLAVGDQVAAGAVVVELNGRPVIALAGALPVYRDLRPNETGPDVTQVQAALRASGSVLPKAEDGRFGAATQQAVLALYDRAGYEARYTQPSKAAVDALVNEAVTELEVARSDLAQATSSNDPSAIRSAKGAVSSAESTLAQRKATEGVVLPASEVLVVSELPGVLIDRPVEQGSRVEAGTPVVAVGSTNLVVRMDLTTAQAGELDGAGEAHVDDPGGDYEGTCSAGPVDSGAPATGVAPEGESTDATGDNPVSGASEDDRGPSLVLSCTPAPGLDMVGANLRVTVTVPRSDGPVLAVPASAVATDSAGTTSVEVVDGEEVNRIEVSVGREAVGTVEVVPEVEGTLHEGMRVRVRHR